MWRREGKSRDPEQTVTFVQHGGSCVMAWACMAASGTVSVLFIDDVTADNSSKINSEVYRDLLSSHIQPNNRKLIGRRFTVV